MAMALGSVPVFMRVGEGPEYEIGSIEPEIGDMELGEDGTAVVTVAVSVAKELPRLLRAVADEMEKNVA
jgi:hypothetical protein